MPTPAANDEVREGARLLARLIEPLVGQVYFSPECHARYEALGFSASPGALPNGVALPDGPAYFTSRGSALGQAPGELVAAAFGVFNVEAVVPAVTFGWGLTDASTIADERLAGAIGAARADPRTGARRDRARQRAAGPGRGAPRAVGTGAVRGHAVASPSRHPHGRPVPARRPPARVPRRQPHRRMGRRRARRHRDRSADRAVLGHADPHLHPHPGVERRPARRRGGAAGGRRAPRGRHAHRRRPGVPRGHRAGDRRPDGPGRQRPR